MKIEQLMSYEFNNLLSRLNHHRSELRYDEDNLKEIIQIKIEIDNMLNSIENELENMKEKYRVNSY